MKRSTATAFPARMSAFIQHLKNYMVMCVILALLVSLAACSGGNGGSHKNSQDAPPQPPEFDFSAVGGSLDSFIAGYESHRGASVIIEHRTWGVIYEDALGEFTLDTRAYLASVNKSAVASLLLALASDPELDFDIDTPIENYLPWMGAYPRVTAGQMLSNTSGMPNFVNYTDNPNAFGKHLCQLPIPENLFNAATLLGCAQGIYETLLPDTLPPGTDFRYGSSQWQLVGGLAEVVGGASWAQLFDQYIAQPCGIETWEWTRMPPNDWDFAVESLSLGHPNPNIEAGGVGSVRDLARLASLHLHDGQCGETLVLDENAVMASRVDRGSALGSLEYGAAEWRDEAGVPGFGYSLGRWVRPASDGDEPSVFFGIGAAGSWTWVDIQRGYAASVLLAAYNDRSAVLDAHAFMALELIPLIEEIIDNAK